MLNIYHQSDKIRLMMQRQFKTNIKLHSAYAGTWCSDLNIISVFISDNRGAQLLDFGKGNRGKKGKMTKWVGCLDNQWSLDNQWKRILGLFLLSSLPEWINETVELWPLFQGRAARGLADLISSAAHSNPDRTF